MTQTVPLNSVVPCAQDLTALNTFGLQAKAQAYVRFTDRAQLPAITQLTGQCRQVFVLGGGSNVVMAPHVNALVVHVATKGIRLLEASTEGYLVQAQAGENWHDFVRYCLDQGWFGLENLALIPGTVGAAPVQNIGAYGVELDQFVHQVRAWDMARGEEVCFTREACRFSYRDSFFKQSAPGKWLILSVQFFLPREWRPTLGYPDLARHEGLQAMGSAVTAHALFEAVCEIRRKKLPDPAVLGNAGSFFKNPVVSAAQFEEIKRRHPNVIAYAMPEGGMKLAAGWLIDRAGWKGKRIRDVGVHGRQALVLVNHGQASALEVRYLADEIRKDIRLRYGVDLEQEPVNVV
ncbi:MAG: UDP-N-acetylenolpyruvoylglucosamine reductase [Pusillimonas sp.]|jgi:UDP-N-acetylmuramate dehydrogenase|nr:UDP-N-acetylenolpyruvoylglucosamine reductase [Pusillimonas sp.]|tara:strand:- start:95868 stop:96911 length:1044 start_codon:yes stop_codon:yes gene_type:complete